MTPRTITITVADYQRLEQKWLADLAQARRESVVFERRIGELEAMLDELGEKYNDAQTAHERCLDAVPDDRQKIRDYLARQGIET